MALELLAQTNRPVTHKVRAGRRGGILGHDHNTVFMMYLEPLIWPKPDPPKTVLQRLSGRDHTAVIACLATYGDKVWTLAKRFTRSVQEAELVSEAIFRDIWIYSATDHENADPDEDKVITQIAIRRLLKNQWAGRDIFQSTDEATIPAINHATNYSS